MRINVGDLVSDWPYGEPWPNYGIVIEQRESEKMAKVSWFPSGNAFWVNTFTLTKIKQTDRIYIRRSHA